MIQSFAEILGLEEGENRFDLIEEIPKHLGSCSLNQLLEIKKIIGY